MKINNALKALSVILFCSLGTKTFADDVWIAQKLLTPTLHFSHSMLGY